MPTADRLTAYFRALAADAAHGDAREESFYGSLGTLLGQAAAASGRTNAHVTTLPKKTDAGNPDFRVWDGQHHIVGYVEAKAPSVENLDAIEDSEQLERYLGTFPNLILTNFCEFRLYRNGERIARVLAARPYVLNKLGKAPPVERGDELLELLDHFFSFSLPKTFTAESLATELAKRTRFLRDIVAELLAEQVERKSGTLLGFYEAFDRYLLVDLSVQDFADLYAQTITYGLFAARTRAGKDFSRRTAFEHIPRTIGILRDVFQFVSLGDLPAQLEWIVDDIAEVLAVADAGEILDRFYREGKGSDPIVHFYETFLAVYDPAERERRGVYYTPEPVVGYIVRSLHKLLKTEFGRPDGLASKGVTLLDPAAGTMTFVARATEEAVREFEGKYGSGGREEFIREHILKNFYAFELMMAPYAIGHLKMGFYLEELGHKLSPDERFQLYLTNTLEMEELDQTNFPGMESLARESHLAGEVKRQTPILVILGNPPYSVNSTNKSEFIEREMAVYKADVRGERNLMPLSDDYVKFVRFSQWKIDNAGHGVVGIITNHSYLDNPTFRGLRRSLIESFDEIRVLDLHGNSMKGEVAPQGQLDNNVFDIRQGVAIMFLIKRGAASTDHTRACRVFHAQRWGSRGDKYSWLSASALQDTAWEELTPRPDLYLFVPRNEKRFDSFQRFRSLASIFRVASTGIKTHRDDFVVGFDRQVLESRVQSLRSSYTSDEVIRQRFKLRDNRDWKLREKRKAIASDPDWKDKLIPILYRPFDVRWIFYHPDAVDFPREEIMRHMLACANIALVTPKQQKDDFGSFATVEIAQHKTLATYDTNYIFPLYLYPDASTHDLFTHTEEAGERNPNLNLELVAALTEAYGQEPTPEQIFHYVYAVLYAPSYRELYNEFLRTDFPRIPFTADAGRFRDMAALGERLAALHLLKSSELDPPIARFHGEGNARVAKNRKVGFRYDPGEERVWINDAQFFEPVAPELWEYRIGGYQVLEKWLKDRRERQLSLDEIRTYCRIVTAIAKTIELQEQIDELYAGVEEAVVEIGSDEAKFS